MFTQMRKLIFCLIKKSDLGAMCAICDVNEYRKCVRVLNSPLVIQLFDILHALCNLLLVKHENLPEVCGGETLVCSEKCFLLVLSL